MKSLLTFLFLTATAFSPVHADRYTELAQKHLEWVKNGQGDSVLVHATPTIKQALSAPQINALWGQLGMQLGKIKKEYDWEILKQGDLQICRKIMSFERATLAFQAVFDKDMKLAGISFVPAQVPAETEEEKPTASNDINYRETDFYVKHGQIALPGTLTYPLQAKGALPVVVLVHGSGPNDRDETLGPNKPFRDLAHDLAGQGIAVLRYEKRTKVYGADFRKVSDGEVNYDTETVDDAVQAIRQLSKLPEFDAKRIYVLGHSLGGMLLPRIAEKSEVDLAGLIAMAAPTRTMEEMLYDQLSYIARSEGTPEKEIPQKIAPMIQQMLKSIPEEYDRFHQAHNPLEAAQQLKTQRMLFVQGGHDYQVTKTDWELWHKATMDNPKAEFAFYEDCDHLMRSLPKMAVPADYLKAGQMKPEVWQRMVRFIQAPTSN